MQDANAFTVGGMQDHAPRFKLPSVPRKNDGSLRLVGFELEFSGIGFDRTVEVLRSTLGASTKSETAAEQVLHADRLGDFIVEVDWDYLKRKAEQEKDNAEVADWMDQLTRAAALVVPIEIACPPIAITDLDSLSAIVVALRDAGAVGTEESLLAAYGVHINAEIPRLDAATLFSYLAAFAILQWWLIDAHEVDTSRKVSTYIRLYSEEYVKQLLSRSGPTMDEIFSDYLEHNANRNRALDLLPLLAEIDENQVRRAVGDTKIKPRPAFHYRMPNCHIERTDWSLADSWNVWWVVEQLANRPDDLEYLGAAFLAADRPFIGVSRKGWVEFIEQWLNDHELA